MCVKSREERLKIPMLFSRTLSIKYTQLFESLKLRAVKEQGVLKFWWENSPRIKKNVLILSNFFKIWYVKRYDNYCSCHVVTFSKKSTWRARESKVYKKCVSLTALCSRFSTHFGNNFGKLRLWKVWSNKKKAWKCIWSTLTLWTRSPDMSVHFLFSYIPYSRYIGIWGVTLLRWLPSNKWAENRIFDFSYFLVENLM